MIQFRANQPVEYVSRHDSAVDPRYPGERAHYERTYDKKHLKLREGAEPTIFVLRRLTRRQFQHVAGLPSSMRDDAAVAFGLVSVKNLKDAAGADVVIEPKDSELGKLVNEEVRDRIFAPELVLELAEQIYNLSALPPTPG